MQKYPLILIFLHSFCCILLQGQSVFWHEGAEQSESLDKIVLTEDGLFGCVGYRSYTDIHGVSYTANQRDFIVGQWEKDVFIPFGKCSSNNVTICSGIAGGNGHLMLVGNGFDELAYQDQQVLNREGASIGFFMMLNRKGQLQWVRQLETEGSVFPQSVSYSEDGFYTLALITEEVHIDGLTFTPKASQSGLLLHWSLDGQVRQGVLIDGSGTINSTHLAIHESGIYISGTFKGDIELPSDTFETRTADFDGFIVKIDSFLNYLWGHHLQGVYEDEVNAMVCDEQAVYLGGRYIGAIRFDTVQIISGLRESGYVGAFSHQGEFRWLNSMPGDNSLSGVEDILLHGKDLYLLGWMGNYISYQGDTFWQESTFNEIHSYILRLGKEGNRGEWSVITGQPRVYGKQLVIYQQSLTVSAEFEGQLGQEVSAGSFDIALVSLFATSHTDVAVPPTASLHLYPVPTADAIHWESSIPVSHIQLLDASGRILARISDPTTPLMVAHIPKGRYFLYAQLKNGQTIARPFIKL